MTYTVHHCICTRYKHRPGNKIWYEKNVLNKGLIYVRCHNNIKGKIENTYILEGITIVFRNFTRITSKLNYMCTH